MTERCYAILVTRDENHYFYAFKGHVGIVKTEDQAIRAICPDIAKNSDSMMVSHILTKGVYKMRLVELEMSKEGILKYASEKIEIHTGLGGWIDLVPLHRDPEPEWLNNPLLPVVRDSSKYPNLGYEPLGYRSLS